VAADHRDAENRRARTVTVTKAKDFLKALELVGVDAVPTVEDAWKRKRGEWLGNLVTLCVTTGP
jgi:hypothetical protein